MKYEEAFFKANSMYGVTEEEWDSYIEAYLSHIESNNKLPDGFELLKNNDNYAISKSGIVITSKDWLPVTNKRTKESKILVVKIGDDNISLLTLMAKQYLNFKGGLIIHKDGDIYNVTLSNIDIISDPNQKVENKVNVKNKIRVLNFLSNGLEYAKKHHDVSDIKTTYKPISEVKSGDVAISYKEGEIVASPIIASMDVIVKTEDQLKLSTEFGSYTTSTSHPVPILENKENGFSKDDTCNISWTPSIDVDIGDTTIVNDSGIIVKSTTTSISSGDKDTLFRDLTVKDTQCYFVKGDGESSHLIHNTRKGSVAVYLEPWHMDMDNFLATKKDSTEDRLSATDLFPALWANDLFFEREEKDADWTLFDPYYCRDLHHLYGDEFKKRYEEYEADDSIPKKTIKAKSLMKDILTSYYETGSPFITLKDEANRRHQCKNIGPILSTNLCTEIFNATSPGTPTVIVNFEDGSNFEILEKQIIKTDSGIDKVPSKLNQTDFIKGKKVSHVILYNADKKTSVCNLASINLGKLDSLDDLKDIVYTTIRGLDNTIDVNYYPVANAKDTNIENRSIGLGVMGEHHYIAKLGIHYGSQEHFEIIDELYEKISYYAIEASIDLAVEKGSYPEFKGSGWSHGILPIDTANGLASKLTTRKYTMDWESLRRRVKLGIRNGYILAIAPTSSISVYCGTTSSVEPIYKRVFIESNIAGAHKTVVPDLSPQTWEFYESAYDIDQNKIIEAAAIRQKWLDQSQSLNLFIISKRTTGGKLRDMYRYGVKLGIKSFYYLRSKSEEEIVSNEKDDLIDCEGCQ